MHENFAFSVELLNFLFVALINPNFEVARSDFLCLLKEYMAATMQEINRALNTTL